MPKRKSIAEEVTSYEGMVWVYKGLGISPDVSFNPQGLASRDTNSHGVVIRGRLNDNREIELITKDLQLKRLKRVWVDESDTTKIYKLAEADYAKLVTLDVKDGLIVKAKLQLPDKSFIVLESILETTLNKRLKRLNPEMVWVYQDTDIEITEKFLPKELYNITYDKKDETKEVAGQLRNTTTSPIAELITKEAQKKRKRIWVKANSIEQYPLSETDVGKLYNTEKKIYDKENGRFILLSGTLNVEGKPIQLENITQSTLLQRQARLKKKHTTTTTQTSIAEIHGTPTPETTGTFIPQTLHPASTQLREPEQVMDLHPFNSMENPPLHPETPPNLLADSSTRDEVNTFLNTTPLEELVPITTRESEEAISLESIQDNIQPSLDTAEEGLSRQVDMMEVDRSINNERPGLTQRSSKQNKVWVYKGHGFSPTFVPDNLDQPVLKKNQLVGGKLPENGQEIELVNWSTKSHRRGRWIRDDTGENYPFSAEDLPRFIATSRVKGLITGGTLQLDNSPIQLHYVTEVLEKRQASRGRPVQEAEMPKVKGKVWVYKGHGFAPTFVPAKLDEAVLNNKNETISGKLPGSGAEIELIHASTKSYRKGRWIRDDTGETYPLSAADLSRFEGTAQIKGLITEGTLQLGDETIQLHYITDNTLQKQETRKIDKVWVFKNEAIEPPFDINRRALYTPIFDKNDPTEIIGGRLFDMKDGPVVEFVSRDRLPARTRVWVKAGTDKSYPISQEQFKQLKNKKTNKLGIIIKATLPLPGGSSIELEFITKNTQYARSKGMVWVYKNNFWEINVDPETLVDPIFDELDPTKKVGGKLVGAGYNDVEFIRKDTQYKRAALHKSQTSQTVTTDADPSNLTMSVTDSHFLSEVDIEPSQSSYFEESELLALNQYIQTMETEETEKNSNEVVVSPTRLSPTSMFKPQKEELSSDEEGDDELRQSKFRRRE